MAAQRATDGAKKQRKSPARSGWADLSWGDLENWAGSRSVARGRSYQRGGRVKDLAVTRDGELLATVVGGDRYAVTATHRAGRRAASLKSTCTCPVGYDGCKHAVATVAEYLEALAEGREVPIADDDDPRWEQIETRAAGDDGDWDDEEDEPWADEDDVDESPSSVSRRVIRKASRRGKTAVDWDEKIEKEIRAKPREELADLVCSLTRRFPELYQEFREQIALREGDVTRLVQEARAEIRRTTSEPAWRNHWSDEGHTPDYSRIRHRFERLLELGHADEVVALGRELIEQDLRQVGQSHDEGETATELNGCLPVVFQAVTRSSLSGPERLLFAIDAKLADDYSVVDEASASVLDADFPAEDWSSVADTLLRRLKGMPAGDKDEGRDFSHNYHRDRLANWVAQALGEAGRDGELQALYESEARATGSYERLIKFLMEHRRYEDAEKWAREGIAAVSPTYAGIRANLLRTLGELAGKRKQWDVVAAHAAFEFFDRPSRSTFDELIKAAKKANLEEPVRAAAMRFLETGKKPYQVSAPPPSARPRTTLRTPGERGRRPSAAREAEPEAPPLLGIDRSWPLPVPEYLVPHMVERNRYAMEPRPHPDILLEMAIAAKQPDEVLRWYDKMRGTYAYRGHYADSVAAAVVDTYPEKALAIYREALEAQLPHANLSAYETAVGYLRKMRPIYEKQNRKGEWSALIASIRESYRNRPRFTELLDGLEGRTIIQSVRPRRK
jgi:uncharacterized Zn finger protein